MISARILAISISWAVLSASPSLCAEDLSMYREFQFGMNLPAVVKPLGINSSEARVIHQRPELIQEPDWQPSRSPGSSPVRGTRERHPVQLLQRRALSNGSEL
jgi:hypothetical protein